MGPRHGASTTVVIALSIALTACASPGTGGELDPDPQQVGRPAPIHDASGLMLPAEFDGATVVDPGWQGTPQQSGGVYLAFQEGDRALVFSAISETGTVLWEAQRPKVCSGFVVTNDGGRDLAVLMNLTAGPDGFGPPAATAYDLHTGEEVWGPVDVPGPHQGPGLVFAAPPVDYMGDSDLRVALDPATGHVIADEQQMDGAEILGEYGGVVVLADDGALVAWHSDGDHLWRLSPDEIGWPPELLPEIGVEHLGGDLVLLGNADTKHVLIDLADGTVVADGIDDGVFDRATGTYVVLGEQLRAYDAAGQLSWAHDAPAPDRLEAAGHGVVYARSADGIHVYDVATGNPIPDSSSAAVAVPLHISEGGAGVVGTVDDPLLVTAAR